MATTHDKLIAADIFITAGCKFMPIFLEFEIAALAIVWTTLRRSVEPPMPLCGQASEIGQAVAR